MSIEEKKWKKISDSWTLRTDGAADFEALNDQLKSIGFFVSNSSLGGGSVRTSFIRVLDSSVRNFFKNLDWQISQTKPGNIFFRLPKDIDPRVAVLVISFLKENNITLSDYIPGADFFFAPDQHMALAAVAPAITPFAARAQNRGPTILKGVGTDYATVAR